MKKILSFLLVALMLVSMVPTVMAADVDVSEGTTIKVVGTGADTYTVTVPAKLAPGESGTVKANGTWPSNQTLNVTAPSSVTLTHGTQTMDVGITFDGISQVGSDTGSVSAEQTVAVASATALFGTWTGTLTYTVEMVEDTAGGDSGTTDPSDPDTGSGGSSGDITELHPDDGTTPANGDVYTAGDYTYTYSTASSGWKVALNIEVTDKNQTTYGAILESINGEPVTDMYSTFNGCKSLTAAPVIPDSVTYMNGTFWECTSLTTAPEIPDSVTDMGSTFYGCKSLTAAPVIPDSVTSMYGTFRGCTSLTAAPEIPDSVTYMHQTFYGCESLTTAPEIPASVMNMQQTFYGCTGLTGEISIPCSLASKNYTYTDCPATITYYHVDGCDGSCGQ